MASRTTLRRLVLWDVDGTLVQAGDVGAAVFDEALEIACGRRPDERIRMSGKTDPQIVREYLAAMGIEETAELVPAVLAQLARALGRAEARIAAGGRALPGVAAVLERLAADERVVSSLLTGNIAPNAVVKLGAFGLDRWVDLQVGAYGSDDADRTKLVPVALSRLAERHGAPLSPDEVWVVGDTPRDLACARAGGARCALVATGRYGYAELSALGADAVLEDLTDTDAVTDLLTGDL